MVPCRKSAWSCTFSTSPWARQAYLGTVQVPAAGEVTSQVDPEAFKTELMLALLGIGFPQDACRQHAGLKFAFSHAK